MILRVLAISAAALALVGLAGCAAGGGPSRAAPRDQVYDLNTATTISLASRTVAGRATLLWFWAPWCEVCNAEAPKIKDLARSARLRVIGVGGRDSVQAGEGFVRRHGLQDVTMVYDEPAKVWERFRVGPQPTGILLDAGGREVRRWQGPFEPAQVEAAARRVM
jgi:thiol-disulfide isomerase/thioredoxin